MMFLLCYHRISYACTLCSHHESRVECSISDDGHSNRLNHCFFIDHDEEEGNDELSIVTPTIPIIMIIITTSTSVRISTNR